MVPSKQTRARLYKKPVHNKYVIQKGNTENPLKFRLKLIKQNLSSDKNFNSEPEQQNGAKAQELQTQTLTHHPEIRINQPYAHLKLVLKKTSWRFNRKSSFEQELERFLDSLEEYNEKEKDIITRLQDRLWKLQEVAANFLEKPEMKLEFQIVGFEFLASLIHSQNFQQYWLDNETFPYIGSMLNEYRRLFLVVHCILWNRRLEEHVLFEASYGSLRYWEMTQETTLFSDIEKETFMKNIKDHFSNESQYRTSEDFQPLEIDKKVWSFKGRLVTESASDCTLHIWEQEIEAFQKNLKSWDGSKKENIRELFMGLWEAEAIVADYLLMPARTAEFRIVGFEFLASLLLSNVLSNPEKKFYYTRMPRARNEFYRLGMYIYSDDAAHGKFRVLTSLVYGSLVYWGKEIDQDLFKNIGQKLKRGNFIKSFRRVLQRKYPAPPQQVHPA
ncbi:hypothetical protein CROQUDRAFT_675195 [Cronartium quercuum f. sp. fusiforme G11]|uniref:Uncharacterized protein n=1 Tax=Cronartium quercuum f. sp. fusiforme G11 TaxID=708437 RepID=A0A9P6N5I3_9BASI|nr:hypothetical protein CROQUDRAFT_675195 [Cronartium quercuum f. sp. fusiforme G11]